MNRGWSSLYSRASSRRSVAPPPHYSGVLFDNSAGRNIVEEQSDTGSELTEQSPLMQNQPEGPADSGETEKDGVNMRQDISQHGEAPRGEVTLPLPAPELNGIGDCSPRYPLTDRKNRKYSFRDSCPLTRSARTEMKGMRGNPLSELFGNAGIDDLLLAALILMMLECGAERNTILLLGFLLI